MKKNLPKKELKLKKAMICNLTKNQLKRVIGATQLVQQGCGYTAQPGPTC